MDQVMNQPPPMSPSHHITYAGFWKRFAAHIIDKIILGFVALIILVPSFVILGIGFVANLDEFENVEDLGILFAIIGAYLLVILFVYMIEWLYFAIMESTRGATVGKLVLNIEVTDLQGKRITFGRASGRYFGKILSGLLLCIGFIMAGITQQKQALHDILASTLVVNRY